MLERLENESPLISWQRTATEFSKVKAKKIDETA
jgi:hypothetical protein